MTHRNRIRLSKLSVGLIAALAAAPVFAQSTSAGVGGLVTDNSGQPVTGAEVVITHVESGTVSRATTDASGRYNARGLRVGGPYEITITKSGAGTKTEDNVYLSLNQVSTVNAALTGDLTTLGTVTAVGVAGGSDVFSATKMGSGTSVDQVAIQSLPSMNGNIQDFMRLDPRVTFVDRASGSISAGGTNPRFNKITIDGVSASDTFGLEGNNMPTLRQPVSLEVIEAIDVSLSNYDVTIAGAAGANVNAVTKSGSNQFRGSVYGSYRDGDWFGEDPNGADFTGFKKEQTYGATFGGPLVKDKLFFFLNYEKYEQFTPGTTFDWNNYDFSSADLTRAQQIARDVWGFDAGETTASDSNTVLEEYAAKFDWNINDNHRANFRFSKLEQSKLRPEGSSASLLALSTSWFVHEKTVESYVGQLFSDWTDNFSTEFKVSYRDYSAVRVTPTTLPQIQIYFGGTVAAPSGDAIRMGTERSSMNNVLQTKTWNYYGAGTWTVGDHDIKFGAEYSENDVYNFFAQDYWGNYTFYGLDNFAAGIWSSYGVRAETSPGSIPVNYTSKSTALFLQDTWYPNANLTLTFGLRADKPDATPKPEYNPLVETVFGYNNSEIFNGDWIIQPRFGFNYTFDSELRTQVRGGIGLFQGDAPSVWIGNAYSNTGLNALFYGTYTTYRPDLPFTTDGLNQPTPATAGGGTQTPALIGHDFELPSVWKANLAIDHELPWHGIVASAELMLTDVKSGMYYSDLNLGPGYTSPVDGRTLYYRPAATGRAWTSGDARFGRDSRFGNVYLIDNTGKGKSQQLTVSLNKPWSGESDWSWNLGYTYTNATEVAGLTSSTANSGYNYSYVFNSGEDVSSTARYEIRDRFSGSLNWKHAFFGNYETQVGLFYEGRSGRPYSYVFVNDANGDSRAGNDLFYVPAARGDVLFGALSSAGVFTPNATMEQAFWTWMEGQQALQRYSGSYAPSNAFRAGWTNTFDLRFSQELPGFFEGHKSKLWLDIQNVGNLLNKDWGHIIDYGFFANSRVATLVGIYDGKYVYNFNRADDPAVANADADGVNRGVSQWSVQVGFKYEF